MSLTGALAVAVVTLVVATAVLHRRVVRVRWRRLLREASRARQAALPNRGSVGPAPHEASPANDPAVLTHQPPRAGKAAAPTYSAGPPSHEPPRPIPCWRHRRWPLPRLGQAGGWPTALAAIARRPALAAAAAAGAMLGLLVSGVVAATVLAVYGSAAAHLALRAAARRDDARSRAAAIDAVAALAAELRAGLAVSVALPDADRCLTGPAVVGADSAVVARRVASAIEVAETSGAPLAEVLDRLDAHLRATDRARAAASAQAAGARASAALLAAMPVAGAGLGFLVGTDPLAILLNTPLGAACLGAAVMLQLGGLAWAARISRVQVAL